MKKKTINLFSFIQCYVIRRYSVQSTNNTNILQHNKQFFNSCMEFIWYIRSDFDLTMKMNVLISYVLCDLLGFSMTINRNLSRLLNCVLLGLFMFDFSSQASSCPSIYCWCNNNIFIIIRNNVFTTCRSWAYFRWSYFACVNNNYFSPYNYFIKKIGRENYLFNLFKI